MISTVASWEGYFQFASQVLRQKVMICQQDKKKEGNRINISEALRYFGKSDLSSPRGRQPSPFDELRAMARQTENAEKDSRFHFKRATCSAEILVGYHFILDMF